MTALQTIIVASNVLVFALWRIPSLQPGLVKYATVKTGAGFIPSLLSMFSHSSFIHLFVNMYVLISFMKAWEQYAEAYRHVIPQDIMSVDRLLAFYLSAGFVANAASLVIKHLGKISVGSLGASGAILGMVGYICIKMPRGQLSIAFLPQFSFSASSGLLGIMLFDTVGLLVGMATKWRYMVFDHAAHLGGLFFGIWYARYGELMFYEWSKYVRKKREEFLKKK